jgi:hypothetical protein
MSRGLLGKQSRLQMRQGRKEALQQADVLILAGAICDFRLSYGSSLQINNIKCNIFINLRSSYIAEIESDCD